MKSVSRSKISLITLSKIRGPLLKTLAFSDHRLGSRYKLLCTHI
jgi:hypothetical protein